MNPQKPLGKNNMPLRSIQLLLFLFATLAAGPVVSQNDLLRVRNFGIEDGLSHRDIHRVGQDAQGFAWIVTKTGLDRYDGHQFVPWQGWKEKNFLPGTLLYDLLPTNNEVVWASRGDALLSVNTKTGKVDTLHAPAQNWINGLCLDGQGRVWATFFQITDSTSWLCYADDTGTFKSVARLSGKYAARPLAYSDGLILVGGGENEVWAFDSQGKQVKQFEFPAPRHDKRHSRVVQLQAMPDGTLWALLDHGQVYFRAPGHASFSRHPVSEHGIEHFHSSAFLVEITGDIWMGGLVSTDHHDGLSPCTSAQPGPSLLHFNSLSERLEDHSFFLKQALPYSEAPRQLFQDQSGVIWIATPFGLIRMVENTLFERFMTDNNDCCRDGVCSMRGMAEDDRGNIYFSYYSSIHVLNPRNGSLTPLFPQQINAPYFLLHDQGYLYTGEGLRINLRTLQTDTVVQGMAGIEGALAKTRDGTIWFGNGQRLVAYDPATSSAAPFDDPSGKLAAAGVQQITCLLASNDKDYLWAGTRENGIFKIHLKSGVAAHVSTHTDPALPHDRVLCLLENNGHLWVATAAGLARLHLASNDLKVFTTKDGLPNNFINGLLPEGDSALWASTDNGLCRLDLGDLSCSNFFHSDGLSNNEFNRSAYLLAKDGRMYFGGIDGVNAFYPNARYGERRNKMNSGLLFTRFTKFDGHQETNQLAGLQNGAPLLLSHADETFTFHFSLSEFSDPKAHLYSYMLEGHSNDWSEPSPLNFARFVNVPPGSYTFRARASRAKGEWVKNELAVPITIRQAFYKTFWFRVVALGLLALLAMGFLRYRLYLARKHEHELEKLVQQRTRELETEKAKSDQLLLNILPADAAEELKQHGFAKARRHDNVTVMFTDFKGFSFLAQSLSPEELVAEIDHCFRAFDAIIEEFGLEKIKTVGDAYLCGGGLHGEDKTAAAVRVVGAALKIQQFLATLAAERCAQGRPLFEARIGIHAGPVVGGIVGSKKFAYDIWGETVNISERLQANGETGKVNISKPTFELVKNHFACTYRGKVAAKHQGEIDMYFVEG